MPTRQTTCRRLHGKTTNRAQPCTCANSGWVRSLRRLAWTMAAPSVPAHWRLAGPFLDSGETSVVSMASWAPWNSGNPSATTSMRRLSASRGGRSMSCTRTWVETRAPASRQTRAAALSNGNPRRPRTPACGHAARWHRDRVDGRTGN